MEIQTLRSLFRTCIFQESPFSSTISIVKRFVFYFACFSFLCVMFHLPLLSAFLRFVVKEKYDAQLCFRSLHFEDSSLVFSEMSFNNPDIQLSSDELRVQFRWDSLFTPHIVLNQPYVTLKNKAHLPSLQDTAGIQFSLEVKHGTVEWGGEALFSLDYSDQGAFFSLDWDDAGIEGNFDGQKLYVTFQNFDLSLFKPWGLLCTIKEGRSSGRITFSPNLEPVSAHVAFHDGALEMGRADLEKIEGSLSYNANLGAKWELSALAKEQEQSFTLSCVGKGFFKSRWIESSIQFDRGRCTILGGEAWSVNFEDLGFEKITFFQRAFSSFFPNLQNLSLEKGVLSGKAFLASQDWSVRFEGSDLLFKKGDRSLFCETTSGMISNKALDISAHAEEFDLKLQGPWDGFIGHLFFQDATFDFKGSYLSDHVAIAIEKGSFEEFVFCGQGWINQDFDMSASFQGEWELLSQNISFECPILEKRGDQWMFDIRLCQPTWDLARLRGKYDGKNLVYSGKSHFLGEELSHSFQSLDSMSIECDLPFSSFSPLKPLLANWGVELDKIPTFDRSTLRFSLNQGFMHLEAVGHGPDFHIAVQEEQEGFKLELQSPLKLDMFWTKEGSIQGSCAFEKRLSADFSGKFHSFKDFECSVTNVFCDLSIIDDSRLLGILEGSGHVSFKEKIVSDFDLASSSLVLADHRVENEGPLHFYYSSDEGVLIRGVNLHGPFDCKIDLVKYEEKTSLISLLSSQIYCNTDLLESKIPFLEKGRDLEMSADLFFSSDLSSFLCQSSLAKLPFDGKFYSLENLYFQVRGGKYFAHFFHLNDRYELYLQGEEKLFGRVIAGEEKTPLIIDWHFADTFFLDSIEGSFGGVQASFHAESPNVLVGSASLNFKELSKRLPKDLTEVFEELEMGKGYELKGRLKIEDKVPSFEGILGGKALELFGFQFRTLLAQIEIAPTAVTIRDIKISDSAGSMKIDEIALRGSHVIPWTIAMPNLTIQEFRPSLLMRPNQEVGPIDPLVVRELKLKNFQGLLDDSKTYKAEGELYFINSYKRGETVFDLPANILSRIVGLDLELLIPVRGNLRFDLQNGYFRLLELFNAFSEGGRSQFFLEMDPLPTMDLDGNLNIFIKMKQFVLLKFTESFLISIDGRLNDPDVHLKKKKIFGFF